MEKTCFVAMPFGRRDTDQVYDNLIVKALKYHRIVPIRIDRNEHNNDIDNEIISQLKKCDLVICDLTYARPSVYYEAGFADGFSTGLQSRKVPVIYTCRKDHFTSKSDDKHGNFKVHFDLSMKNIISWSSSSDAGFLRRLKKRIHVVTKKNAFHLGGDVKNGVHFYASREEIPRLNERLSHVGEIIMIGITLTNVANQHLGIIKNAVQRGASVTLLVLDPNSEYVKEKKFFSPSRNVSNVISNSLDIFSAEKNRLGRDKQNLKIKTFDFDHQNSMIIINPKKSDGYIQIEEYTYGVDPTSRRNQIVVKNENKKVYDEYYKKYVKILKHSKEHVCK